MTLSGKDCRMSNRLAVLAADIRAAHQDNGRSSKYSAERAVEAGRMLLEAKNDASIPRGGWRQWVEREAGIPYSTAQRYCQLVVAVSNGSIAVDNIARAEQQGALPAAQETGDDNTPPAEWTTDQRGRKRRAERGECVLANMREGADEALIAWAKDNVLFVRIDRRTEWGNPFKMPDDGDRAEVCRKHAKFYFPNKPGLLARTRELQGKVLGCWCYPQECHGQIIAEIVNREADDEARTA
jgi:hypothetical protein